MNHDGHCAHCVASLGLGPRLQRILAHLVAHAEDLEDHDLTGVLEFQFGRVNSVKVRWVPHAQEIALNGHHNTAA